MRGTSPISVRPLYPSPQALNAIVFLYRRVLDQPIEGQLEPVRAKRRPSPPVVMTKAEIQRVLGQMQGTHLLMAKIHYGCGLRLMECVRLRVQDIDWERSLVYVRAARTGRRCSPRPCKASCGFTSRESNVFTKKISPKGLEKFSCLLRFPENIRVPAGNAAGSIYSRQKA